MITSTNHFFFMAILAHGSRTGSAGAVRWVEVRLRGLAQQGSLFNKARYKAPFQDPTLFSFDHAGVQVCHRESHSTASCGPSNRRYSQ
jgi:hypothetical protein